MLKKDKRREGKEVGRGRRCARKNENEGESGIDGWIELDGMCWQDQKEGRGLTFLGSSSWLPWLSQLQDADPG